MRKPSRLPWEKLKQSGCEQFKLMRICGVEVDKHWLSIMKLSRAPGGRVRL